MEVIELIMLASDDPRPQLEGDDIEDLRIVKHRTYNPETGKHELEDGFSMQFRCPCCGGDGYIRGTIWCDAGCDHDVEAECDTCESQGWCDLEVHQMQSGELKFVFCRGGHEEEVEMTEYVLRKYISYLDGWGGSFVDPNQLELFEETP